MAKNIIIISSEFTGHGHKSIAESLLEQFSNHHGIKVHVIDGFTLGGNIGTRIGKLYGTVTRNAKDLWKLIWDLSIKKPSLINEFVEIAIKENFLNLINNIKPDLILSIHPNFNSPVINILNEYNIKVPFVTLIADLVSITPLWADPRAEYIICPTAESAQKCMEYGVDQSKLKFMGFPVRARFYKNIDPTFEQNTFDASKPLRCLIMSGGEGVGNMSMIAKIILANYNSNVKIIAGRNKILSRRLKLALWDKYPDRVEIYGFTHNIQDLMCESDIAFTRGSPNVAMEAVACNTPLVITGALPGQEEGNPAYLEKYNLGVVCNEIKYLRHTIDELLKDNASKLNKIRESQRKYRNPNIAANIVNFLLSIQSDSDGSIPEIFNKQHKKIKILKPSNIKINYKRKHKR
jgi:processive 1,2-diacylglycerol beta-glucosyltransferase